MIHVMVSASTISAIAFASAALWIKDLKLPWWEHKYNL